MAETDSFGAMVRRLGRWVALAGVAGSVGVVVRWGWAPAAGFAFGAVAAFLNMRWLANALLRPEGPAVGFLVLRFALFGGAAYVILETFGIGPLFVLAGLLTASVAVFFEILFQLFYART